jgi:hypothetical protein
LAKPMSYNVFQRIKIHVPSFFPMAESGNV